MQGVDNGLSLGVPTVDEQTLNVKFYKGSIFNEAKTKGLPADPLFNFQGTEGAGRPIYDEIDRVQIRQPGSKDIIDTPVWDEPGNPNCHTARFPNIWKAYKAGLSGENQSGTPLEVWPGVTRAQVEELKHFGVKTVEHLAVMADSTAQKFMGALELRKKAKAWLEASAGTAHVEAMNSALEVRDETIAKLQQMLKEQGEAIAELKQAKPVEAKQPEVRKAK